MRLTLTRQIAFLLLLTADGALATLSIVYRYLSQTAADGAFLNLSGRQRMLSEQLSAYAHMVQIGQEEDRAPLQALMDDFDQALQTLKQGGRAMERDLPPAPVELEEEFAAVDELWQQLHPALLTVARQPVDDPEAAAAYAWVRTGHPLLTRASHQVVVAFEARGATLRQRLLGVLAGIAGFDLALLFLGVWIIRRYVAERHQTEQELRLLHQVREEIWRMQSPDDLQQLLEAVGKGLERLEIDFRGCGINVVDPSREPPAVRFHSLVASGEWTTESFERAPALIVQLWRGKEPCYRRDLEAEDPYQEKAGLVGIFGPVRAVLDVPFSHGTLAVNSFQPEAFSEEEIAALQALAGVLSEGFQRLDDLQTLAAKEEQLQQAQKLESLGLLAGGVAHDFNNLLTIIKGYGQFLAKSAALGPAERASLGEIDQAAARAAALVRQLLAFSRRQVAQPQVLDLNEVVEGVGQMLGRLLGENIELVAVLDPQIGKVKADPGQLEQVLVNLAVNARDAMPDGGKLTIETAGVELDQRYVDRRPGLAPGAYVLLSVRDTGMGMAAETQSRIFEPFFTTKEVGRGTGLGLSVVYGIVSQSNGYIGVDSRPGEGATFRIYLPRVGEENRTVRPDSASPAPKQGRETLLMVEDEATIRRLMERTLAEQGYTVLAAGSGEEALQLAAPRSGEIDLLITDMGLPGMRGDELAARMAEQGYAAKVLYISGHLGNGLGNQGMLDPGTNFLQKPFTPDDLVRRVRQLLDAGPRRSR